MTCRQFRKRTSSYLDDQLASRHQRAFALHLATCEACQIYLRQVRAVSESLRHWSRPPVPRDLLAETLVAFEAWRQEREASPVGRVVNWAVLHSRAVSAVASFLITILCYGGILGQLKPIPYLPPFAQSESIKLSSLQYDRVNGRVGTEPGPGFYTFPRLQMGGQVDPSLAGIHTTSVVVIALVRSDGRASLVEVLEPRSTPQLVEQVQAALGNLKFRPAMTGGRPVPTQLVLMMERVDVRG